MGLRWLFALLLGWGAGPGAAGASNVPPASPGTAATVYVLPIREPILPPLTYLVRRGVKEAMEARADLLVLDMNTDGGRVDVTEEIIGILNRFPGRTVTYVNDRAFSAGAFIAVATQQIYMAPQSVIGAAAPLVLSPTGGGAEKLPDTVEAKMTSAIRALVRTQAEKNGHNIEVIEAMIDKTRSVEIDGETLNREGSILTLTDRQAARPYGQPPKPLLSAGTVESLDALLAQLGFGTARRVEIRPTGTEQLGTWLTAVAPVLLVIGILGFYLEFNTPGFGLPGIIGILAFLLYFLSGYVAGLSPVGWMLVFLVGILLVLLELFVFPGTFVAGIVGTLLLIVSVVMAMVDYYPGTPALPRLPDLRLPARNLGLAVLVSVGLAAVLARFLPRTRLFGQLVSVSASGAQADAAVEATRSARLGHVGTTTSRLSPGGKARFDDELLDVITRGELVEKGRPVRIIGHSGPNPVVEEER